MSHEYLLKVLEKIPHSQTNETKLSGKINPFIEFDSDLLTATYVGKNLVYSDTTSIQSNKAANKDLLIDYFEIHILELAKNEICVGFADSDFPMNKHPGHTKNSYGYQSDGSLFTSKKALKKMNRMKENDTIGCGINFLKKEIFYTHNGNYFGPAFAEIENREFFATLGMHGPKQKVRFNFGKETFRFNLEAHLKSEKDAIISSILSQEVHHFDIHKIVQSYLYFNGYFDTLQAFESATKMTRETTFLLEKDPSNISEFNYSLQKEEVPKKERRSSDKLQLSGSQKLINSHENISIIPSENNENHENSQNGNAPSHKIQTEEEHSENNGNNNSHNGDGSHKNQLTENSLAQTQDFNTTQESSRIIKMNNSSLAEPTQSDADNLLQEESQIRNSISAAPDQSEIFLISKQMHESEDGVEEEMQLETEAQGSDDAIPALEGLENDQKSLCKLEIHKEILEVFRKQVVKLITQGESEFCAQKIIKEFPVLLEKFKYILPNLYAQAFIERIMKGEVLEALLFARNHLNQYQNETFFSYNEKGIIITISAEILMGLLAVENNNYKNHSQLNLIIKQEQRQVVSTVVNNAILDLFGCEEQSVLELILRQLQQIFNIFKQDHSYIGEIYSLKV